MMKFVSSSFVASALVLAGCDPSTEKAFTQGRALDACVEVIPACPGLFASCTLDQTRYARTQFPGAFRFFVDAGPEDKIQVQLFFAHARDAGLSTQIVWNEPGCSEAYVYDSGGRDLFSEAGETNLFAETRKVYEEGEHLIEIFSDMNAEVLVGVDLIEPGTR